MENKKNIVRDLTLLGVIVELACFIINSGLDDVTKMLTLVLNWILYAVIIKDSWYY